MSEDGLNEGSPMSPQERTSLHVRKAIGGDADSLNWIIGHLAPLLILQARLRLPAPLQALIDPEDIVHEVWSVSLPKLKALVPRAGRYTPVLLSYLGRVQLNVINNLIRRHLRGRPVDLITSDGAPDFPDAAHARAATARAQARSREQFEAVVKVLLRMKKEDQEIVVLRAVESLPFATIGAALGIEAKAAQMRYDRARTRLVERLPGSVLEELGG